MLTTLNCLVAFLFAVVPTVVVDARVSVLVKFPPQSEGGLSGLKQQIGILVNNSINSALIANHEPAGCIKEDWVEESEQTADDESSRFLRGGRELGGNETQNPSSDPSHAGFKCLDCPEGCGCATWCDDAGELPYANSTDLHDDIKSRIREGIAKICKLHDCFHLTECAAICADYELTVDVLTTDTMAPTAAPTPLQECPDMGRCTYKPYSMRMEYTAGHCGGSVTTQIGSTFECTDYGNKPLPTEAWILVTRHGKKDKVYHWGVVLLGQTFELVRHNYPGKEFEDDLDIYIYSSQNQGTAHLGQKMTFRSTCDENDIINKCQDRYGAVQLKEWENKDQGLVACDRCDPDLCPPDDNGDRGIVEKNSIPFVMIMLYNGGDCSQTQQSQVKPDKFECEDLDGGPPSTLGDKSFIIVTEKGDSTKLYHSALEPVHVGETYKLAHPDLLQTFEKDLEIEILNPKTMKVLQRLTFSPKKKLGCDNRFGASQLIEWTNSKQGNVQCSDCVV